MDDASADPRIVIIGNRWDDIASTDFHVFRSRVDNLRRTPTSQKGHGVQEVKPRLPGLVVGVIRRDISVDLTPMACRLEPALLL